MTAVSFYEHYVGEQTNAKQLHPMQTHPTILRQKHRVFVTMTIQPRLKAPLSVLTGKL